jgi:hypothetical protein
MMTTEITTLQIATFGTDVNGNNNHEEGILSGLRS